MSLEDDLAESKKYAHRLLTERDKLQARNDSVEATLALYGRVQHHMPIVGVTCDGDKCAAAIGVVGVNIAATDAVVDACVDIARACGWHVYKADKTLCPACKKGIEP